MGHLRVLVSVLAAVLVMAVAAHGAGQSSPGTGPAYSKARFVPGQVIVRFKPSRDAAATALNLRHRLLRTEPLFMSSPSEHTLRMKRADLSLDSVSKARNIDATLLRTYKLVFSQDADVEQIAHDYSLSPDVESAQPNYVYDADWVPNDNYFMTDLQIPAIHSWGQSYPDLYGLKNIGCQSAWEATHGQGVVVAVIDSGGDYNHVDLSTNVWSNSREVAGNGVDDDGNGYVDDVRGWNFVSNNNNPIDDNGHGTHVAGIVAAWGNNMIGVVGVANGAKVMVVKCLDSIASGTSQNDANAIRYAANNGARILNCSWGSNSTTSDPVVEAAIDYAYSLGCIIVCSAGNQSVDVSTHSPANYAKTIAVAAVDYQDVRYSQSNFGSGVDISAPGVSVLSLRAAGTGSGTSVIGNDYFLMSGTSMAAPHVSGTAALIWSLHPDWTSQQVTNYLLYTADDIDYLNTGYAGKLGAGRLNAANALGPARPCIRISNWTVTDISGNPNGIIEPGETLQVSVTLKNLWTSATNVVGNMSSTDAYVSFGQPTAAYGSMPTSAEGTRSFTLTVSSSALAGRVIPVQLVTSADGGYSSTVVLKIKVERSLRQAWPKHLVPNGVTPVDLDGNGQKEVVVLYESSKVAIYRADGTPYSANWPRDFASGACLRYYNPSFGDIDGDGRMEMVLVGHNNSVTGDKLIHVVDLEGDELPGWPLTIHNCYDIGQAAIADIDPTVPGLEIAVTVWSYQGSVSQGSLRVFTKDGQNLTGFPFNFGDNTSPSIYYEDRGLAVADIDRDGSLELLCSSYPNALLYAVDNRGVVKTGWPFNMGYGHDAVEIAVADLVNDMRNEIVVLSYARDVSRRDQVYVLKSDGTIYSSAWSNVQKWCSGGSLAIGDLDNDGDWELVFGNGHHSGYVYALHHTAANVPFWPAYLGYYDASVGAIADVDGDGNEEVVASSAGNISLWHNNGSIYTGANPLAQINSTVASTYFCFPSASDLTGNGAIEVLGGMNTADWGVCAWDFAPAGAPKRIEWPMSGYDPQRTSYKPNEPCYWLTVDPKSDGHVTGGAGGPYSSTSFTLTNVSTSSINWSSGSTQTWVSFTPSSGTLTPGQNCTVAVSVNSFGNGLGIGDYSAIISFKNASAPRSIKRNLTLTIGGAAMSVTPSDSTVFAGIPGGPFTTLGSSDYVLSNTGYAALNWTAAGAQPWLTATPSSGVIPAGGNTTVTIFIRAQDAPAIAGTYTDTVTFTNTANGNGNASRGVTLVVGAGHLISCLAETKTMADNTPFSIIGPIVTATFGDRFYVESDDRLCAIGVLGTCSGVGKRVVIEGTITTSNGERMILASGVVEGAVAPALKPWFVRRDALGGAAYGMQGSVYRSNSEQPTATAGPSTVGLLIKTTGRVVRVDSTSHFYLDGAVPVGGGDEAIGGLRVEWPFLATMPANGAFVEVTGVSSCRLVHINSQDVVMQLLRPTTAGAVRAVPQ